MSEFEEWGNPKQKPAYEYMVSYSPYDNVKAQAYPAMLVRSSYNDTPGAVPRAGEVGGEAARDEDRRQPAPAVDGHGARGPRRASSGRYESLHEDAFGLAFVLWQLGLTR